MKFIWPSLNLRVERWKWNDEYRIYVSNYGHFKDEYKRNLPIKINKKGYCTVKTCLGYRVAHRVVLKTWRPCPDSENLTVDHLNHNKRDNSLENLEWVTCQENLNRAARDLINEEIKETPGSAKGFSFQEIAKNPTVVFSQLINEGKIKFWNDNDKIMYDVQELIEAYKGNAQFSMKGMIRNWIKGHCFCGAKWKFYIK